MRGNVHFAQLARKRRLMFVRGFRFDKAARHGKRVSWRCWRHAQLGCQVRATTDGNGRTVRVRHQHNHPKDGSVMVELHSTPPTIPF